MREGQTRSQSHFARNGLDASKVIEYAGKLGNSAVIKRLGYITEVFGWDEHVAPLSQAKMKSRHSLL